MKKYLLLFISMFICMFLISACDKNSNDKSNSNSDNESVCGDTTTGIYDNKSDIVYTPIATTAASDSEDASVVTTDAEYNNSTAVTSPALSNSEKTTTKKAVTTTKKVGSQTTVTTKKRSTTTTKKTEAQPSAIKLSNINMPSYGEKYADISIPSVGINLDVYYGDSTDILKKGIGQYTGSSIFGYGKKILLCGHNSQKFLAPLGNIAVGDIINITTSYGSYSYKIYDKAIKSSSDGSAYSVSSDQETLILYTCYPLLVTYHVDQRLIVYAHKISGPNIIK